MPTRNVDLTDHFDSFIEDEVSSGQFNDASEVVREGLRLLEQRKHEDRAKLEWLRGAIQEGEDAYKRGEYVTLHSEEERTAFLKAIRDEVLAVSSDIA
jgi:antitoxin ParD1/3/4